MSDADILSGTFCLELQSNQFLLKIKVYRIRNNLSKKNKKNV
jgi:hypothetical protein